MERHNLRELAINIKGKVTDFIESACELCEGWKGATSTDERDL
jgi:hypothetical protein